MLFLLIFFVGFLTGDITWALKVVGAYVLALLFVEVLFRIMCFGFFGMLFAIFL